jgi:cytochrome b561
MDRPVNERLRSILGKLIWFHQKDRYYLLQILIHWLVVLLVIEQYWSSRAILRMNASGPFLGPAQPFDMVLHEAHIFVGLGIFVLIAIRVFLRIQLGAPAWNPPLPIWRQWLSLGVQFGLYGVLLAQSMSGAITSYLWWRMSIVHKALFYLMLLLIAMHIAGALWSLTGHARETILRITGWRLAKRA